MKKYYEIKKPINNIKIGMESDNTGVSASINMDIYQEIKGKSNKLLSANISLRIYPEGISKPALKIKEIYFMKMNI